MKFDYRRGVFIAAAFCASLALTACNNDTGSSELPGESDEHDHDHDHGGIDSAGRLIITHADGTNSRVHVYDLEDEAIVGSYALTYPASSIYASPEHRYALLFQRDNDQIQVLDSGLHLHDDHVHADDPAMLGFILSGIRPTHYRVNDGQAAVFYDGNVDAGALAGFALLTDESLAAGGVVASQSLSPAHHGIAEPLDGLVLASGVSGSDGRPDGIDIYELHGDHFHGEGALATACPGLHGGASNESFSVFGCTDGVLVAELHGDHFHEAKLDMSERVASVLGHHGLDHFAAFASPSTNLYEIDPSVDSVSEVDWRGGAESSPGQPVNAVRYALDSHGEHPLILDDANTLHVLETSDWRVAARLALPLGENTNTAPALAFSGASHHAFVTDAANQSIHRIDLETLTLDSETIALDFAPEGLAWTGIAGAADDHDGHGHGHGHDHDQ